MAAEPDPDDRATGGARKIAVPTTKPPVEQDAAWAVVGSTPAEIGVGKVSADSGVGDADLARPWLTDSHILGPEDFGLTGFVRAHSFGHRSVSPVFVALAYWRSTADNCSRRL